MKFFIWKIRYAIYAMRLLRCSPLLAWQIANQGDSPGLFEDEYTPKEALDEELTYWEGDCDD